MSEKICGEFCAGICQISYTGRFCVRTIGASCGIFFCLSVLSHNHSCGAGAPVIVRLSCAWPPPPHLGGHIRNAPCINYQVCARGVFRSQSARPFISMLLSGMKCPGFQHIWAKTRENGAFYGSRPVGNAGESICFRDSDRQTGICRYLILFGYFTLFLQPSIIALISSSLIFSAMLHDKGKCSLTNAPKAVLFSDVPNFKRRC